VVEATFEQWHTLDMLRLAPGITEMLRDPSWVHRVVESIEFLDEARVRRQVSLDFTVPEVAPSGDSGDVYIPLQVLTKGIIKALEVGDGEGRSVPVLTSDENGILAGEVLIEQATKVFGDRPNSSILSALRKVADTREVSPKALTLVLDTVDVEDRPDFRKLLDDSSVWTTELWNGFLLVGRVRAAVGERVIVTRSYEEDFELTSSGVNFTAEALFRAGSYHLELLAPEGAVIADSTLDVAVIRPVDEKPRSFRHCVTSDPRVDRAHLYGRSQVIRDEFKDDLIKGSAAVVWLLPRRALIEPVLMVSLFVSLTFIVGGAAARAGWLLTDQASAAAVVVALPALAAGYVASKEHRLTQRILRGVQWSAFWSAAASFGAAFTIVIEPSKSPRHLPTTNWVTAALAVAALVLLVGLPRQIIARACKPPKSGFAPNRLRAALAKSGSWLVLAAVFAVAAVASLDLNFGRQTPQVAEPLRTWLWVGFTVLSVLTTVYLVVFWGWTLWNSRPPADKDARMEL
jgi:hypothetical protein